MTVITASYSSIEEAWADSYLSPSIQKPKSKKSSKKRDLPPPVDPICDLYEMGGHDDADLVKYANSYYETHEKSKYQKPRMLEREKQPKVIDVDVPEDLLYGAPVRPMPSSPENRISPPPRPVPQEPDSDAESEDNEIPNERQKNEMIYYDSKEAYQSDDDDAWAQKNRVFNHFDLALYIISGIILIFMMEQFVKIGLMLKS